MNADMNLPMVGLETYLQQKSWIQSFLIKYSSIYLNFIPDIRVHEIGLPLLSNSFSETAVSQKIISLALYNSTEIGKKSFSETFAMRFWTYKRHVQPSLLAVAVNTNAPAANLLHWLSQKG